VDVSLYDVLLSGRIVGTPSAVLFPVSDLTQSLKQKYPFTLRAGHRLSDPPRVRLPAEGLDKELILDGQ
jgi:hypothetical protein